MKNHTATRILLGILLLLVFHFISYFLYTEVLTQNGLQRKKAQLFEEPSAGNARIWIMGDSHPMLGLNPDSLPSAFNWAGTSEYYFLSLQKLKFALNSQENRPEMLLLPLDLHSFSAQGNALLLHHELDDVFWSSLISPDRIIKARLPNDYLRWWTAAKFFPYAGQYYRLITPFRKEGYTFRPDGFTEVEENFGQFPASMREEKAGERFRAHFEKYPCIDSLQLAALEEISQICKKNQIQLLLISFPLSPEYAELAAASEKLKQLRLLHDSISKKELFLNYRAIFMGKPEFFSDPDHLNVRGAAILSALIRDELKKIRQKPASTPPET